VGGKKVFSQGHVGENNTPTGRVNQYVLLIAKPTMAAGLNDSGQRPSIKRRPDGDDILYKSGGGGVYWLKP
jgi:hypothetical protein